MSVWFVVVCRTIRYEISRICLISAADLLHRESYYLAVAHAAYYSCFQLLECIWLSSMGKSWEELDTRTRLSGEGAHVFLLREVVAYISSLKSRNTEEDARTLRNTLPRLKRLRTDADYKEIEINCEKSGEALGLSRELLLFLKRYL